MARFSILLDAEGAGNMELSAFFSGTVGYGVQVTLQARETCPKS